MSQLKVTPASAWRKELETVEMPSGNIAQLRRLNMLAMIRKGDNVPNFLATKVMENLQGQRKTKAAAAADTFSASDAIEAVFWLAKNVFAYPRLVEGEPQADDEVCIDHISEADLAFAATFGTGDAVAINAVAAFRDQAQSNVEPLPAGEELVSAT
jgi:hypothetical protein